MENQNYNLILGLSSLVLTFGISIAMGIGLTRYTMERREISDLANQARVISSGKDEIWDLKEKKRIFRLFPTKRRFTSRESRYYIKYIVKRLCGSLFKMSRFNSNMEFLGIFRGDKYTGFKEVC